MRTLLIFTQKDVEINEWLGNKNSDEVLHEFYKETISDDRNNEIIFVYAYDIDELSKEQNAIAFDNKKTYGLIYHYNTFPSKEYFNIELLFHTHVGSQADENNQRFYRKIRESKLSVFDQAWEHFYPSILEKKLDFLHRIYEGETGLQIPAEIKARLSDSEFQQLSDLYQPLSNYSYEKKLDYPDSHITDKSVLQHHAEKREQLKALRDAINKLS